MTCNLLNFDVDDLSQYENINQLKGAERFNDFASGHMWETNLDYVWSEEDQIARPIISWYANNRIPINDIKHSKEQVDIINRRGITIICYEPVCIYDVTNTEKSFEFQDIETNKHNFGFYSEFSSSLNNDNYRCSELDSIKEYATLNGIDPEKIDVITCDYALEEYCNYYNDSMNLIYLDVFIQNLEYFDNLLYLTPKKIRKHFITTTWRYTSARAAICAALPLDKSHLGWHFDVRFGFAERTHWLKPHRNDNLATRIERGISDLNRLGPFPLDCKYSEFKSTEIWESHAHAYPENIKQYNWIVNPASTNRFDIPLAGYYTETFCDVVVESRFAQPTANFSEKVFQAMQFKTPFILVAPPHTLQILKDIGFQTFDKWWNENYDNIEDHYLRMEAIIKIIDKLSDLPISKLTTMYKEMRPVLQHNFDLMVSMSKNGQITTTGIYQNHLHGQQHANMVDFT